MSVLSVIKLVLSLTPTLREAVVALVNALKNGDEEQARKAYEAARRAAFIARQK